MKPYASIETVFTRDKETNKLNFGEIRMPEVECVREWTISEKVDGTNIRVIYTLDGIQVKGRTDKADLPSEAEDVVLRSTPLHQKAINYFTAYRERDLPLEWSVTLYGELYGPGINKGGVYSPVKKFRAFDLLLGESWWTDDDEMRRICLDLGVPTMPRLANIEKIPTTKDELLSIIPYSLVAENDNNTQSVVAEGIVGKPSHVLLDRHGHRVMWKLTGREFPKEDN